MQRVLLALDDAQVLDLPSDVLLRVAVFCEPKAIVALQRTSKGLAELVKGPELLPLWLMHRIAPGASLINKNHAQKAMLYRKCTPAEADYFRALARHAEHAAVDRSSPAAGRSVLWGKTHRSLLQWLVRCMAGHGEGATMLGWLMCAGSDPHDAAERAALQAKLNGTVYER